MTSAHFCDGFSVLSDACAGFIVANQHRFVAFTLQLSFHFSKIESPTPFTLQVLDIAKPAADICHTLSKFTVGWDEHKVVGSEAIRNHHFHCSGPTAGNDDHFVAVITRPRLRFTMG